MSEYSTINHIGALLASLRLDGEDIIVSIGAHDGSTDTPSGHMSATVRRGQDEATSNALRLADALSMARGKLTAIEAKRADDRKKAKQEAAA